MTTPNIRVLLESLDSINEAPIDNERRELDYLLDELSEALDNAIHLARQLAKKGRGEVVNHGPFAGQLQSYMIPHLEAWIHDEYQPGSIASLRRILESGYDE